MRGLFPWLREAIFGNAPKTCRTYGCNSFQHAECGAGSCAMHCRVYCEGFCKKAPPKLGVVLGMRR